MKPSTWKWISISLGVVALLISINALYNKNWILGIFGVLICIVLIVLGIRVDAKERKMPLDEVIKKYKEYMEQYFQISLPLQVEIYHNEENMQNYILVLAYENNDGEKVYFPFEADLYSGEFGRGMGQFTKDVREIEFWIHKYAKTYKTADEIGKSMSNQVAKRIREELEFQHSERGSEEYDKERRTTGGE
jgi:hypothetical protein